MPITNISRDWGANPSIVRLTTTDNLAAITAPQYLTSQLANIEAIQHGEFQWVRGDLIAIVYNGGEGQFTHDAINNTFVLNAQPAGNIILPTSQILVGNGSNVAAPAPMTGDVHINTSGVTAIQAGVVGSTKMAANIIQLATAAYLPAAIYNMYASPRQLIGAQGANKTIYIKEVLISMQSFGTAYTGGGNIAIQYGNAVHGGGVLASATIPASTINGWTVSSSISLNCFVPNAPWTSTSNTALYVSNDTAPFATGTGIFVISIWYAVILF